MPIFSHLAALGLYSTMAMNREDFVYCPYCAARLVQKREFDRERPTCPQCGFIHYRDPKVATVGFVVHDGQLLLIQRAIDPARGKWALPGGFVDAGELPEVALARELQEEVGLDVVPTELLEMYAMERPGRISPGFVLVYRAELADGELLTLKANDDVAAAGWFAPDEIPTDLAFESTKSLISRWRQGLL